MVEPLTCRADQVIEPHTIEKADKWQTVWTNVDSEYSSLLENLTWDFVRLHYNREDIPYKWVFKYKENGSMECYKACLVVKWYAQKLGINYDETFSSVAISPQYMCPFILAAQHAHTSDWCCDSIFAWEARGRILHDTTQWLHNESQMKYSQTQEVTLWLKTVSSMLSQGLSAIIMWKPWDVLRVQQVFVSLPKWMSQSRSLQCMYYRQYHSDDLWAGSNCMAETKSGWLFQDKGHGTTPLPVGNHCSARWRSHLY